MIIEISQDDILKNVGTENLFEKNNYLLNEETDIILNGDFDGDVIYDFFDYLFGHVFFFYFHDERQWTYIDDSQNANLDN